LRLAAGRPAKVEIAGRDHQLGAPVDQLDRDVADGDRVGFAVDIHELDLPAQNTAIGVQVVDRHFGAQKSGRVQRGLNAGQ